jgi:hypothetical protein
MRWQRDVWTARRAAPALWLCATALLDAGVAAAAATPCVTAEAHGSWAHRPLPPQTGRFAVQFDATPSTPRTNALIALSSGPQTRAGDFAGLVSFGPDGHISARNGATLAAAASVPYAAGTSYHFRLVVNAPARTYSIFVQPVGSYAETIVGLDYALRSAPGSVAHVDTLAARIDSRAGTLAVCNVHVRPLSLAAPVVFGTPAADEILRSLQVFPPDNHWNLDVSSLPRHPDSDKLIAAMGPEEPLDYNLDMGVILVPSDYPRQAVALTVPPAYPAESDGGLFPIPPDTPIENWPLRRNEDTGALPRPGQTLDELQRAGTGDRHIIVVDPDAGMLYEWWQAYKTDDGWKASIGATFDLKTNALRPLGWTSAEAAGLPIFPAVVRYDEVAQGLIDHALRVTTRRTRKAYVYPARHHASPHTDPSLPRMGERLRLRASFDVSGFPPHARVVLEALKKYGMFVADNGRNWLLSISPDARLLGLESLTAVKGSDFEVVDTSRLPVPETGAAGALGR